MRDNTIFLIVGESGSGKDTAVNKVVEKYGVKRLNSYTTRPCRGPGDLHIFMDSMDAWKQSDDYSDVVGYTHFNGHDYWATSKQVNECDLYIIDPAGVEYFKKMYKGPKDIRVIYFSVAAHVRLERMLRRGDGLFKAVQRIWHDMFAFRKAEEMADWVVYDAYVNDTAEALWLYMN